VKKSVYEDEGSGADEFRLERILAVPLSVAAEAVTHLITRTILLIQIWRCRNGVCSPRLDASVSCRRRRLVSGQQWIKSKSVGPRRVWCSWSAEADKRPEDGRGRLLRLTRKGTTIYASIGPTARAIEGALAPSLTKAEWSALHKALAKLSGHAQSILAETGADLAASE